MSACLRKWAVIGLVGLAAVLGVVLPTAAGAQDEISRKVKSRSNPVYPEIARRMSISGTVKVEVVVSPNGAVKSSKIVGGHPVLATAALDAVKKWKFEPASEETTGVVEFKFQPQ